jgi:pyridoxine 5-phosphate synthase
VPENRKEITTEGGLNLKKNKTKLKEIISRFQKRNIRTSLFINPSLKDIRLSKELKTDCIEIHTGKIANLVKSKKNYMTELQKIKKCSILANNLGLEVHAGHGLDYKTTKFLTKIKQIKEFNIGHFLVGESIFNGLPKVIKSFKRIINKR